MRNLLIIAILVVSSLTAYFSNQAVEKTTAVQDAQTLATELVPTINFFREMLDEVGRQAVVHAQRARQLEQFIFDNGLVPPLPPAAPRYQPLPRKNLNNNAVI